MRREYRWVPPNSSAPFPDFDNWVDISELSLDWGNSETSPSESGLFSGLTTRFEEVKSFVLNWCQHNNSSDSPGFSFDTGSGGFGSSVGTTAPSLSFGGFTGNSGEGLFDSNSGTIFHSPAPNWRISMPSNTKEEDSDEDDG